VNRRIPLTLLLAGAVAGCGSTRPAPGIPLALVKQARPIGQGPRFHPPARGRVIGPCRPALGRRYGAHVELFAENRVVLLAAGIGSRPPWSFSEGRIVGARCYGDLVTLEPTGVVLIRPGVRASIADLFRAWGEPLSPRTLAGFPAPGGTSVAAFVDGRRVAGPPGNVPLTHHAEIVLEVGPYVPPHTTYTFPPGA
jgi:hypothetical protein